MTSRPENPFATPADLRDPVRRLRGRLVSPVTVLTAGAAPAIAGITVSSLVVLEGDGGRVAAVLGRGSEFTDAVNRSGYFVVHVLGSDQSDLAGTFAGYRPSPGGMFAASPWEESEWGPVLTDVSDWAGCAVESCVPIGDQDMLVGTIDHLEVSDLTSPLIHFRGRYGGLDL